MADRRPKRLPLAAIGFLLPNLAGFLLFTLFPVLFSFWMAFTNWTPKPAVQFAYLGLRNFSDLLGMRPLDRPQPALLAAYLIVAVILLAGIVMTLWANMAQWRGTRIGGGTLMVLGAVMLANALVHRSGPVAEIAGALITLCGGATILSGKDAFRLGPGAVPALLLSAGVIGLACLNPIVWRIYEPRDQRFWQYAYNTGYLMLGIPFSIAGSLVLALLLSEDLPTGTGRTRILGALLCTGGGVLSLIALWGAGRPDMGLIVALVWTIAALGIVFNVVAFRTLFYVPTFTAGVALMILWKALYNPKSGPLSVGLASLFQLLHWHLETPQWLGSADWAKPSLIVMGIWTSIGGTNMLLYLAGLSNVPRELLDAARVDGAGGWNRFRHVIWPQLAPTTFFITIMAIIGGLQGGFEQARVMTAGGPAGSTTTLSYYIYNKAFQELDLGYAAAISWVLFAIVFIATALNWKFGRGLEVD